MVWHINTLRCLWLTSLKATKWQYTHGVPDPTLVSPDTWTHDQALLDRPGNQEIQLDLFYDYRTNVPLYPGWQEYFRKHQPATLVLFVQAAKFEAGLVHFSKNARYLPDLLAELLAFPNGKHDDQVDSISQALAYEFSGYTLDNVRG